LHTVGHNVSRALEILGLIVIIILIERIRLGWHKPKLRGHLTNVTKIHAVASVRISFARKADA